MVMRLIFEWVDLGFTKGIIKGWSLEWKEWALNKDMENCFQSKHATAFQRECTVCQIHQEPRFEY